MANDVGRNSGAVASPVCQAINAPLQPAADFFGTMRVGHYRELVFVSFIYDRFDFSHRHLILIDQLDQIDSGFGEHPHFGARHRRRFHAPANILSAG